MNLYYICDKKGVLWHQDGQISVSRAHRLIFSDDF